MASQRSSSVISRCSVNRIVFSLNWMPFTMTPSSFSVLQSPWKNEKVMKLGRQTNREATWWEEIIAYVHSQYRSRSLWVTSLGILDFKVFGACLYYLLLKAFGRRCSMPRTVAATRFSLYGRWFLMRFPLVLIENQRMLNQRPFTDSSLFIFSVFKLFYIWIAYIGLW